MISIMKKQNQNWFITNLNIDNKIKDNIILFDILKINYL